MHSNLYGFDIAGKPDPPLKIDVLEITKNSTTLAWVKPLRDGGAKIDGYVVDYMLVIPPQEIKDEQLVIQEQNKPEEQWMPYSIVKDLSIAVVGLKENMKYKFRVSARNVMGCSLPTETKGEVEIKEQMCKLTFHTFIARFLYFFQLKHSILYTNPNLSFWFYLFLLCRATKDYYG